MSQRTGIFIKIIIVAIIYAVFFFAGAAIVSYRSTQATVAVEPKVTTITPWFSARIKIGDSGKLVIDVIEMDSSVELVRQNVPPMTLIMDEWSQDLEDYVIQEVTNNPDKYRHLLEVGP